MLNIVICYGVIIILYYFYRKNKIRDLKKFNEDLEVANNTIRAFRHDFNNMLQAIGGYIKLDDFEGLKSYYKDLKEECKLKKNVSNIKKIRILK